MANDIISPVNTAIISTFNPTVDTDTIGQGGELAPARMATCFNVASDGYVKFKVMGDADPIIKKVFAGKDYMYFIETWYAYTGSGAVPLLDVELCWQNFY